MTTLLHELWTLFILVIISDGIAAALAARNCWRLRDRPKARALAIPLAVFMAAIALVDLSDTVNYVVNATQPSNTVALVQGLIGRSARSAATWYLALKLMNGYSSGHKGETYETTQKTD